MRRASPWAWFWVVLGLIYFFLPLIATFDFSLRALRGTLSFEAYRRVFDDPAFYRSFAFSLRMALLTIVGSSLLVVPTAYWVHLRLPRLRPVIEMITLMPFVVPAVVLAFGFIRIYCCGSVVLVDKSLLLVAGYIVLSLPYMYRAVDTGLRAIDVRTLTEAAQSLGAGWPTIFLRVILPNLRTALLSGAFLTFAIVMGEFTLASLLNWPAFGPYIELMGATKAYEPAALTIISFSLTWAAIGLLQFLGRGSEEGSQIGGMH